MSSNTPTALVTGASYGIGRAIAIELARAGYNLALLARSEADLNETAARVRSHGKQATVLPVDITDDKAIRNMAGRLQKAMPFLNVLINGASASPDSKSFEKLDPSEITNIVDTSVRGTLLVTQALLPFLTASGNAHIIFLASDWALSGSGGPPVFSACKAALAHFSSTLGRHLQKANVKTTTLFAGDIASYDPAWEVPKYDIDDSDEVIDADFKEAGEPLRIPLRTVTQTVLSILTSTASVPMIQLQPAHDPSYSFTDLVDL